MDVTATSELISNVGFPIACVIAMGYFIIYMVKNMTETNAKNMATVQERCAVREDKLYEAIKEQRLVNERAIAAISQYVEKLDAIQSDVSVIKLDIAKLAEHSK